MTIEKRSTSITIVRARGMPDVFGNQQGDAIDDRFEAGAGRACRLLQRLSRGMRR